jgi:hypothetical protein
MGSSLQLNVCHVDELSFRIFVTILLYENRYLGFQRAAPIITVPYCGSQGFYLSSIGIPNSEWDAAPVVPV